MSHQSITIVGYLGADPIMDYTPTGTLRTRFSVATNRNYTAKDGTEKKEVAWFRVTTWGKQGEACNKYLKKGSQVLVEGRLITDPATGAPVIWSRQDGTPATSLEISANSVRFLSSKVIQESIPEPEAQEEDLPF